MPTTHEIPTFLPETVPVEFVSALESYRVEGSAVLLTCAATRYRPQLHNYYGTTCETLFHPAEPGEPATIRLDFCTPEIIRLRYSPGPAVPAHDTPMVVGQFDAPVPLEISESESFVTIKTAALRVEIAREPWQLSIFDLTGKAVYEATVGQPKVKVNIESFDKGIYLVRLQTERGVVVKKLNVR